jgi:hypothetical protein
MLTHTHTYAYAHKKVLNWVYKIEARLKKWGQKWKLTEGVAQRVELFPSKQ